jgi:hypothetical protein
MRLHYPRENIGHYYASDSYQITESLVAYIADRWCFIVDDRRHKMCSFPMMRDLPTVVETTGWEWERFASFVAPSNGFWMGWDRDGNRWLTKLRGDFYAYREIVFGRLAQKMNWSCQSTIFIRLDAESARVLGKRPGEVHGAHWFLDEHVDAPCTEGCELAPLGGRSICAIEDLEGLNIQFIMDWPKSELAACLFGGNEPPGHLFTSLHEFVIIDSELMFASGPSSLQSTSWSGGNERGSEIALEVCHDLLALGEKEIRGSLEIPASICVSELWPIAPLLCESVEYAKDFSAGRRGS